MFAACYKPLFCIIFLFLPTFSTKLQTYLAYLSIQAQKMCKCRCYYTNMSLNIVFQCETSTREIFLKLAMVLTLLPPFVFHNLNHSG
jgi:hypothetical protein